MLPPQSKRCYGENSAIPWVLTEPRLTPYKERETRDEWGNSGVQAHASCLCVLARLCSSSVFLTHAYDILPLHNPPMSCSHARMENEAGWEGFVWRSL